MPYNIVCTLLLVSFLVSSCDVVDSQNNSSESESVQPELIWKKSNASFGSILPFPVIEDSSVYLFNGFSLAKLLLETGKEEWSGKYEGSGEDAIGNILTDNQSVYLRFEESVAAYNKSDGIRQWNTGFEDSLDWGTVPLATPLLDQSDNYIFVGTTNNLLLIDKQQGTIHQKITPEFENPPVEGSVLHAPFAAESGNTVYLLSSYQKPGVAPLNGRLAAYNTADGSLIWSKQLPYQLTEILPNSLDPWLQMAEINNRLVVLTGPAVLGLDAQTGDQQWEYFFYEGQANIDIGMLLSHNENQVYAHADGRVISLDVKDGQEKWQLETTLSTPGRMLASGNRLYISQSRGLPSSTFIQVADAETGEDLSSLRPSDNSIFRGFTSSFDAKNRRVVVLGIRDIYCYQLPE